MQDRIKKATDKIGSTVILETENGTSTGKAVIYPIRWERSSFGGIQTAYEGEINPERYVMFSDREFIQNAKHNDIIKCGEDTYKILWKDKYLCKLNAYIKTYMKKVTD